MGKYSIEETTLQNIANSIRSKTGETEGIDPLNVPEKVDEVFDAGYAKGQAESGGGSYDQGFADGEKSEYDKLWDNLQLNGNRTHYANAFAFTGWNDIIYNPKYPIAPTNVEGIANIFYWNQQITDTKVSITAYSKASNAFGWCVKLKRIPELIFNGTLDVSGMFNNCTALEELNASGVIETTGVDIHWSTKLSEVSGLSIINALSTTTTGLSVTLPIAWKERYIEKYGQEAFDIMIAAHSNWGILFL